MGYPRDALILPRRPESRPRVPWIFERDIREFLKVPQGYQNVPIEMK